MAALPRVIASSVVRSSHPGESHGILYVVDLATDSVRRVLDWNKYDICWDGRGGERGLRGVAVAEDAVFVASYDRLYELHPERFEIRRAYENSFLRDCHEISLADGRLFVASTGADRVLEFDLERRRFMGGYHVELSAGRRILNKAIKRSGLAWPRVAPKVRPFDARDSAEWPLQDRLHLNNVFLWNGSLVLSGTQLGLAIAVGNGAGRSVSRIPFGTHNAMPYRGGVLANDTVRDRIVYVENGRVQRTWRIVRYEETLLENADLPRDYARQAFGRGLCVSPEGWILAGSSPATISVYDWEHPDPIKSIQLSRDVRNAIHGLAIWPDEEER